MAHRYCPSCGSEYREGFDECSDCGSTLVDEPPSRPDQPQLSTTGSPGVIESRTLTSVFESGRRSEAEVAHSFLSSQGIESWIWSSGLSPWSAAASVTEITGLANDFNGHRVMVEDENVGTAEALLATADLDPDRGLAEPNDLDAHRPRTAMEMLRTRWAVLAFAIVLLLIVLIFGPPQY